jgi:SOS-response transcriptional repressor LexA
MEKQPLTKLQEDVYAKVAGYIGDFGYAPTYQEIAEMMGTSPQMVEAHIKNLVAKGWLKFNEKKWRKVELIPKN